MKIKEGQISGYSESYPPIFGFLGLSGSARYPVET